VALRADQSSAFSGEAAEAVLEFPQGRAPKVVPDSILATVLFTYVVLLRNGLPSWVTVRGVACSRDTKRTSGRSWAAIEARRSIRPETAFSVASTARHVRSRARGASLKGRTSST